MRTLKAALHGRNGDAQARGNLSGRQVVVVSKHDDIPIDGVEARDGLRNQANRLGPGG